MKNKIRTSYRDGVISIYKLKESNKSTFGAVKNAVSESDMTKVVALRYNIRVKRDEDINFAEANGKVLTLKVATPECKLVEKGMYGITENVLYSIYFIDFNQSTKELFLYLEEVRKL